MVELDYRNANGSSSTSGPRAAVKETGRTDSKSTSVPVPEVVNLIPESYRDGLEITVAGDNPTQNFELKK